MNTTTPSSTNFPPPPPHPDAKNMHLGTTTITGSGPIPVAKNLSGHPLPYPSTLASTSESSSGGIANMKLDLLLGSIVILAIMVGLVFFVHRKRS